MAPPTIAGIRIRGVLEAVTAQCVQNLVLNCLDRGREIGNQVMGICIERDDGGICEKAGNLIFSAERIENLVINPWQIVLAKTADGFCGSQNGSPNAGFIESNKGAVAFLDFDNAVLN